MQRKPQRRLIVEPDGVGRGTYPADRPFIPQPRRDGCAPPAWTGRVLLLPLVVKNVVLVGLRARVLGIGPRVTWGTAQYTPESLVIAGLAQVVSRGVPFLSWLSLVAKRPRYKFCEPVVWSLREAMLKLIIFSLRLGERRLRRRELYLDCEGPG